MLNLELCKSETPSCFIVNHRADTIEPMVDDSNEQQIGRNLSILIDRAGVRKNALAMHVGVSEQAVNKWVKTGQVARDKIPGICRYLSCSADELLGLTPIDERMSHAVSGYEPRPGYLRFQLMGEAGAGPGMINSEFPEVIQELEIAEWQVLKHIGRIPSADNVKLLTVRGDSMTPKIRNGDVVMVDIRQSSWDGDGLYVVVFNGFTLVKRLEMRMDGIHIISFATPDRPEIVPQSRFQELFIAGRVLGAIQFRKSEDM